MDYNEPLTFGRSGSINNLVHNGLDNTEDVPYSWTIEQSCMFDVSLPIPRQEISMEILATPFISVGRVNSQQLFIYINGLFQTFHTFLDDSAVTFAIHRNAISSRLSRVQLVLPTATSPQVLGISSDIRNLGIALNQITFVAK